MKIRKVMIVDDDPDIRMMSEITLARVGNWQVVVVASGPEALERIADERPDVILLDVMMPGMDGMATLKKLRQGEQSAHIPVMIYHPSPDLSPARKRHARPMAPLVPSL